MQPSNTPADLASQFESTGALAAYLYRQHCAKRLHDEMATLVEAGTIPKQFVELTVAELKSRTAAQGGGDRVESYINQCPDGLDLRFCNYCADPLYADSPALEANIASWQRQQRR